MNENPEGTPNPLNPAPQASAPTAPTAEPAQPTPAPQSTPPLTEEPAPAEQPLPEIKSEPAVAEPAPTAPAPVSTTNESASAHTSAAPIRPAVHRPMPSQRVVDPMMVRQSRPMNGATHMSSDVRAESAPASGTTMGATNNPMGAGQPTASSPVASDLAASDNIEAALEQALPPIENQQQTQAEASKPAKKKKGKKGTIILLVLLFLILIGCGVAAIIIFKPFNFDDRVPVAIEKFLSNGLPSNIGLKGTINASSENAQAGVSSINIKLDAQISNAYKTNTASADVSVGFTDETSLSFKVNEVAVEDGDVYLKISDIASSLASLQSGLTTQNLVMENCAESADGTSNCTTVTETLPECEGEACSTVVDGSSSILGSLPLIINAFETIDGEWIRIPASSTGTSTGVGLLDNPSQCLTEVLSTLPNYKNDFTKFYKENSFIEYSTDNLKKNKVNDNLYRLSFNKEKLTGFINALKGTGFANSLLACTGGQATNDPVTVDTVEQIFKYYPTLYVEINDKYEFTRVAFDSTIEGQDIGADLQLSYPQTIEVVEPEQYLEPNQYTNLIMKSLYGMSTESEGEAVPVTPEGEAPVTPPADVPTDTPADSNASSDASTTPAE